MQKLQVQCWTLMRFRRFFVQEIFHRPDKYDYVLESPQILQSILVSFEINGHME